MFNMDCVVTWFWTYQLDAHKNGLVRLMVHAAVKNAVNYFHYCKVELVAEPVFGIRVPSAKVTSSTMTRPSWCVRFPRMSFQLITAPAYASTLIDFFSFSQMLNLCYVYYLSKLTEFADTVFFVLRKKKTQITWLHLYHHALTPMEAWLLVKFISGMNNFTACWRLMMTV